MDIKRTLKLAMEDLINKQSHPKIPSMGLNPELLNPTTDDYRKKNVHSSASDQFAEKEQMPDQELLESIESVYFKTDGKVDVCRYELEKLPEVLNPVDIEQYYKKLQQQHQVVSNRVLQLIAQKQTDCKEEFKRIMTTQEQLETTLGICRISRADLNLARIQFTTASLGILANYRRKQIIENLLKNLNTIKTLQRTEDHLQELLNNGNYPGAITLLLECQTAAQTYKHYLCVAALNGKLQDTLEQAEETLDVTLSKLCINFDVDVYSSIQEAYELLGKSQTAMDQLHMHFTAAIHNTSFSTIHSYVGGDTKMQYKQLCLSVKHEHFIPCLIDLCKVLWTILKSYHLIVKWHEARDKEASKDADNKDLEANFTKQYIKQKLETGISKIWHDIEAKISTYLMGSNLTSFKFEQFVQILSTINRLLEIGSELCYNKSETLQECIRRQCLSYFSHYHASRLDELMIFLEAEGWELCPVKSTFAVTRLLEFKNVKHLLTPLKRESSISEESDETEGVPNSWLERCLNESSTPFDISFDVTMDEDVLANIEDDPLDYSSEDSDDDDLSEELKRDYIDEADQGIISRRKHKIRHSGLMVTNTTLSVLRICGKYLQMIRLLKSIAVTVIQSMIQFFELYFYTVHCFFTSDLQVPSDSLYNPTLKRALARMKENLILDNNDQMEEPNYRHRVPQLHLSRVVDLSRADTAFGLTERAVGVESLIFLGQQYESFKHYLESLVVNCPERSYLHHFYTQTIPSATDLRKPVYMTVASRAIDCAGVLSLMSKVNWEVRDVMSQHSGYVDALLMEMQNLHKKLNDIGNHISLPKEVNNSIWENVAHLVTHTFVEGYSNAKKCSNGGRALMQLDLTQFTSKFESLTSLRPMPHKEYTELYIKAYYLPEPNLETWLKEHDEYSLKHMIGLVSCTCQNNKKARQRLIAFIEDQRPNR